MLPAVSCVHVFMSNGTNGRCHLEKDLHIYDRCRIWSQFLHCLKVSWALPGMQFQSDIIVIPVTMLKVRHELSEGQCKNHSLVKNQQSLLELKWLLEYLIRLFSRLKMYLAKVVSTYWLIVGSAWPIKDILVSVYIFSRYVPIWKLYYLQNVV